MYKHFPYNRDLGIDKKTLDNAVRKGKILKGWEIVETTVKNNSPTSGDVENTLIAGNP